MSKPHSYEVVKIELLEAPMAAKDKSTVNSKERLSNNSISAAKLLNGVEKSYDKGKYLLDESEKTLFRVTPEHKQHQMDIINETNPAPESNYTWIRSVEDIKSFEEALDDSDYSDYMGEDFDPSYTWNMVEDALKTGKVTVISTVNADGPCEYSAEIEKICDADGKVKNFIIRITDKRLLNLTGGIVQGMSGSPIIQNGKLVGAITHVLIDDPTRGYGIFIEDMLNAAG
jgi:hypothetical protein